MDTSTPVIALKTATMPLPMACEHERVSRAAATDRDDPADCTGQPASRRWGRTGRAHDAHGDWVRGAGRKRVRRGEWSSGDCGQASAFAVRESQAEHRVHARVRWIGRERWTTAQTSRRPQTHQCRRRLRVQEETEPRRRPQRRAPSTSRPHLLSRQRPIARGGNRRTVRKRQADAQSGRRANRDSADPAALIAWRRRRKAERAASSRSRSEIAA